MEWSLQSLIDAHRPDAVRILDFYHAAEYLSEIATLVRNAGTSLAESWLDEQLHELKHQGPAKVLAEVGRLLKEHPQVEELATKVHYLQKREQLMRYPYPQVKTPHMPAPPQRELPASSSGAPGSGVTRRPAPSHPWRRYPRAKK